MFSNFMISCCPKDEIVSYKLTPGDSAFVPYQKGQQLTFKHSAGSNVQFTVNGRLKAVDKESGHEEGITFCRKYTYYYYDREEIVMLSTNPSIKLQIEIFPKQDTFPPSLRISTLSNIFRLQNLADACFPHVEKQCFDSIKLLNHTYYNAIQITPDSSNFTPGYLRAKSIIFNKNDGILQILMSNNESYTLVK
ncbi:MAG: hypothetical protein EOP53_11530 [Sphingobacteriales bacterium]|nr:MAG: hypothetical protein EOP53_11530 [Sphingobacteriales bacterium]